MPRLIASNPTYRRHRPSGQAVVTLAGRDHYCGPYGTAASRREYDRIIGEWLAAGRRSPAAVDLTVAELLARYWTHAKTWYRHADGSPTSEILALKAALGVLARLYGKTAAAEFGPLALDAVRTAMIAKGWARRSVNGHVGRVKRIFAWATAKELVPADTHHALTAVAGLRAGRSNARETEPVRPVSIAAVQQTLPFLSPTVAAMVRLQLLTGVRSGEICGLRTCDVDRTADDVWTLTPSRHKTQHHGHRRTIHAGPQAQRVLLPFLNLASPAAFIFSPIDAVAAHRAARTAACVTPLHYGNSIGTNRKRRPKRTPTDRYDVGSYRRAISRATAVTFPPPAHLAKRDDETTGVWQGRLTAEQRDELRAWQRGHGWFPHQLRHAAATAVRARFGVEAAQHVLGHATLSVTEIYAEKNAATARQVAAAIG